MDLENKMNDMLRQVCNIPNNIGIKDDMSSNTVEGWDSLANLHLISELEGNFGIEFDFNELLDIENWGALKELVKKIINGKQCR
jgi:acyl carrier protein